MSRVIDGDKLIERLHFYIENNPLMYARIVLKTLIAEIEDGDFDFKVNLDHEDLQNGYVFGVDLSNDETEIWKKKINKED